MQLHMMEGVLGETTTAASATTAGAAPGGWCDNQGRLAGAAQTPEHVGREAVEGAPHGCILCSTVRFLAESERALCSCPAAFAGCLQSSKYNRTAARVLERRKLVRVHTFNITKSTPNTN